MNNINDATEKKILISVIIILIVILPPLFAYYSSCGEVRIFNKLNQTEYTCLDFVWAREQIKNNTQTIKLK